MSKHRVLYLPIETKAREFPGKAFLAARAVERGWIVVMGEQSEVHKFMREGPAGAFIEISIPELKAARLEQMSRAGHRIANLCEESLMYYNGQHYCHSKLGEGSLRWIDRMLVLGIANAKDIGTFRPGFADKVAITGNPRFDMLLQPLRRIYEPKADAIRNSYGQFLLVNTNFGLANPNQLSGDAIDRRRRLGLIADESHADFVRGQLAFQQQQMQGLRSLLEEFSAYRLVDRIVVRPHPGEDQKPWRAWAAPLGINVVYEGSANEWMLAAKAVLHPGCTTGIEGLILDRPTFSYVPNITSDYLKLSDRLSQHIASANELALRLNEIGSEKQKQSVLQHQEQLADFIANVKPPFATERILDELDRFDMPSISSHEVMRPNWNPLSRVSQTVRNLRNTRKGQKFPGVQRAELIQAIDIWIEERVLLKRPKVTLLNGRIHVWH